MAFQSLIHQIVLWIVVPILGVNGFVWFQLDALHRRSIAYLEQNVLVESTRILRELQIVRDTTDQLTAMTARDSVIIAAYNHRETDALYRFGRNLITSTLIDQVSFIDPQGIVIARGHEEYGFNDSLAENPYFRMAAAGQTFSGLATTNDRLAIVVAKPVYEFGAVLRGVLIVSRIISPGYLEKISNELGLRAAIGHDEGTGRVRIDSETGSASFVQMLPLATLTPDPFTLTINKSFRRELETFKSTRIRIVVVSAFFTVLAMVVVYFSVRYLLAPLRRLRTWLQQFKDGNLGVAALNQNIISQNNKKNELGFVAHAALSTIQELEAARGELQRMHRDLEVLVDERTRELMAKTAQLQEEIHERGIAEARVRGLKNHLQNIFDSMRCTLIGIDASGTINFVNAHAEAFSGRGFQALCGEPIAKILAIYGLPEDAVLKIDNPKEEQWQIRRYVTLFRGQQLHLDVTTYPFAYGNETGLIIRIDDVSGQVIMEQELFKSEKLKSIGLLAGGLAHDFNNFLTVILGNLSLAQAGNDISDHIRQLLIDAEKASIAAKELTCQLLTFAKGGEPIKELIDLGEPVREAAQLAVLDGCHTCAFHIPTDLWPAEIDRVQIEQVIRNIVMNASQAMPDGEEIEIRCANIARMEAGNEHQLAPGPYVQISIVDKGAGIPDEIVSQIFDPYFSTKTEGTGLGLAICHSIINKHNGAIEVASTPGIGTTFTLYLPASPDEHVKNSDDMHQDLTNQRSQLRILVMDDDLMVQKVCEAMLELLGHQVIFAMDGQEALQRYQQAMVSQVPFDLVIMDLVIPRGMGGKEAVKALHRLDPNARVIVSSGYSSDPVLANYEEYGFAAAIPKPYQLKELAQVLGQVAGTVQSLRLN
nr:ATP-binding protein [uncultured Desulfobulbus sp.]